MKLKYFFIFIISLTFILLSVNLLFAQEKKINDKNLPKAILTSFQKSNPNVLIKGASIEKENGKTYYQIESLDGSQRRDLLYTKEGKVAEIEENLASIEVPVL